MIFSPKHQKKPGINSCKVQINLCCVPFWGGGVAGRCLVNFKNSVWPDWFVGFSLEFCCVDTFTILIGTQEFTILIGTQEMYEVGLRLKVRF